MSEVNENEIKIENEAEVVVKYVYWEEGGYEQELDADDMDEAIELAEDLCQDGDWGIEGASVRVTVTEYTDGEETDSETVTVDVEPDHDAMISRAGGDVDCDHDWTGEGEGGLDENPGVWSTGGTSMLFVRHCRECGLKRKEYHCGSQRNPGERDRYEYEQPDSWCVECQSDDCECDAGKVNDMAAVLDSHGPTFVGNNVLDQARDWLDHDFTPTQADGWCEIGAWDAATAAAFRNAGLTPEMVKAASERLTEAEQAAWDEEPTDEDNPVYKTTPEYSQYTDGCPIYAACNGDINPNVIVDAAAE